MTKEDYVNPSYRRSDHPSFNDKYHNLVIDAQGASNKDIPTESGTLRFENGVAVLPNDERAKDIVDELNGTDDPDKRALHPNQYALVEKKPTVNADPIHNYTFGFSRRLAARWDDIFGPKDEPLDSEIEVQEDTNGERYRHDAGQEDTHRREGDA
jgi:hypothetical protein